MLCTLFFARLEWLIGPAKQTAQNAKNQAQRTKHKEQNSTLPNLGNGGYPQFRSLFSASLGYTPLARPALNQAPAQQHSTTSGETPNAKGESDFCKVARLIDLILLFGVVANWPEANVTSAYDNSQSRAAPSQRNGLSSYGLNAGNCLRPALP